MDKKPTWREKVKELKKNGGPPGQTTRKAVSATCSAANPASTKILRGDPK